MYFRLILTQSSKDSNRTTTCSLPLLLQLPKLLLVRCTVLPWSMILLQVRNWSKCNLFFFLTTNFGNKNIIKVFYFTHLRTGQYKNQLYQSLPQSEGQFTFNQRIQPYVHQQQQQQQQQQRPTLSLQQLQSPLYRQQVGGYDVYDSNVDY